MVDLKAKFLGVEFKNPIIVASGTLTRSAQNMRSCIESGAAGFVAKSVTRAPQSTTGTSYEQPAHLNPARMSHFFLDRYGAHPGSFMHYDWLFPTKEEQVKNIKEVKPLAKKNGVVVIGSLNFAPPIDKDVMRDVARSLEDAGADMIEVCHSCPGLSNPADREVATLEMIKDTYRFLKGELRVPFYEKIGYQGIASFLGRLQAIVGEGGRGLSTDPDLSGIWVDIETGKPVTNVPKVYGRDAEPILSYAAALVTTQTKLQLIGGGGIWNWRDIVERIMCGAAFVSANTTIMYHGWKWVRETLDGLTRFMERKGYKSLADFRGIAAPYAFDPAWIEQTLKERTLPREAVRITVDAEKCNGCSKCLACYQNAISMKDSLAAIDLDLCIRCGLCASICPTGAILLERK